MADAHQITGLLLQWSQGDPSALDRLTPLVYQELHGLASAYLNRERSDHTLQPTALINEAYIRLLKGSLPAWESRRHFFAFAARVMRQVLVDYARKHATSKRAATGLVPLEEAVVAAPDRPVELVALDEALTRLTGLDARKGRIVELRYFAGMSEAEAANVLGISKATARRDMRMAEAWIRREISAGSQEAAP
jgi:RNA polymerase sigma factor (TIGR02999 family)